MKEEGWWGWREAGSRGREGERQEGEAWIKREGRCEERRE